MSEYTLPARYRLEQPDVLDGLRRIWAAALCTDDEATSQVQILADPLQNPRGEGVIATWLVIDVQTGEDIGMAMVSEPTGFSRGMDVLNLYVREDHVGQGIGSVLAHIAKQAHPQVAAYYTTNSVRIYQRIGFPPAFLILSNQVKQLIEEQGIKAAEKQYIEAVVREREELDAMEARWRRGRVPC